MLPCCFARFLGNRDGGVAPMLALAALPLFGFVGAAVDYSRAASARTAMQAALDATALMLSKDAQTLSAADLAQKANDYFKAHVHPPRGQRRPGHPAVQPARSRAASRSRSTASANVNTMFTRLLGQSQIDIVGHRRGAVGHQEAQPRARARQHRLDGVRAAR